MPIELAPRPTEAPVKKPKEYNVGPKKLKDRILRAGENRSFKQIVAIAEEVSRWEDKYKDLSDEELQGNTGKFKERLANGETLDDLLPEAFATVREAAWRVLGMRPYHVQVMGGIALHMGKGNIAEMATGEGKTLVATMPAYLNALEGKGVHVVTVNDYLAKRDAEWMGPVYEFLGLGKTGVVLPNRPAAEHRDAYQCSITYGTVNEFGFDYLRDNMAWSTEERVQRGHNFVIVDEVDSILIDEARTPLIISRPAEGASIKWYEEFSRLAERMTRGDIKDRVDPDAENENVHYEVDETKRTVGITQKGIDFIEDQLGIVDGLYDNHAYLTGYLENALKAKELFKRDKDYIVNDGQVLIVDEFTGRILYGQRYNEGIHQALEAKEHVGIKAEDETLASTTLQNYFRLYDKLSGMTGTAQSEAAEFSKTYKIKVIPIPTHKPMIREDAPDVVYKTEKAKWQAVVEDIIERHASGQPILVGTASVENSEYLSRMLRRKGIPHNVLNAKYHASEAEIVAQAGRLGAVTIATNMAGRGTDILLGGNPAFMAEQELKAKGLVKEADLPTYQLVYKEAYEEALARYKQQTDEEYQKVVEAGGLYVLGTERHESRRIDNQLRGRAGRQGDPGKSRFYLSLQDELMRRVGGRQAEAILDRLNIPDDVPIESKMVTRLVKGAQAQIEAQNAEIRKDLLKYDNVLRDQRKVIFADRDKIMESDDLRDNVHNIIVDAVRAYTADFTQGFPEDWNIGGLWTALEFIHTPGFSITQLEKAVGGRAKLTPDLLRTAITLDLLKAYDERVAALESRVGKGSVNEFERQVLLSVLDEKWRTHLNQMDHLRDGVYLRAYAQRDPLVEYQREGYDMFSDMKTAIKAEAAAVLFNAEINIEEAPPPPAPQPLLTEI